MEIRPPETRSDAREAATAHNRAWQDAYEGLLPGEVLASFEADPDEETVDRWHDRFREDHNRVLVADRDGVCGYALFRTTDTKPFVGEGEASLKEIYVAPAAWGDGVGTDLLERGIDSLPDGLQRVKLEVFADNERGRGFYEARGFDRVEDTRTEVAGREYDTVVYALDL